MRKDLGGQTDGDALHALRQEQGELHREKDRFLVAAVVGGLPFGDLGIEDGLQGKFRQTGFDVTAGGGTVSGEDISPVALGVDQEFLLSELHQRVLDRGIAVRVVLHGIAHDVGHLVVAPVLHLAHGVDDAALNGFETVVDLRTARSRMTYEA